MDNAYTYVQKNGISSNMHYPWTGKQAASCGDRTTDYKISGYADVPANKINEMKAAVAK